jgi:O-antigen ligase
MLGLGVLWLSLSRVGLLAFLVMAAYLMLILNIRLVKWMPSVVFRRFPSTASRAQSLRRGLITGSIVLLVLLYAGLMASAAYGLSRSDERMRKLFDFTILREKSFFHYANQLVFAERIVFWQAGWEVFGDHPILGVGPGNVGFFFPQKLSAFSWALTEVRTLMYQWSALPNVKSLWIRLLSETGIVGFAFFMGWLYVLWYSASYLQSGCYQTQAEAGRVKNIQYGKVFQATGLAGAFVLVALMIEGFSLDTFALPYYWIPFGLLTASCQIVRQHPLSAGEMSTQQPVKGTA